MQEILLSHNWIAHAQSDAHTVCNKQCSSSHETWQCLHNPEGRETFALFALVLGPAVTMLCCTGRTGFWFATFFQQLASLGNNLAIAIVAGQSMKVSTCFMLRYTI